MTRTFLVTLSIFLGICSLAASSSAFKDANQEVALFYNIFKDWASQSHRQYGIEEMALRFSNWKSNFDFVQEQNARSGQTYELGMNEFADMAPEEFSALHLGLNVDLVEKNKQNKTLTDLLESINQSNSEDNSTEDSTLLSSLALPKKVDWRKVGAVGPVRNQGACGGCYAFAAAGALEGMYALKNNKLMDFSVQQMIDCSGGYGNQGCSGGLMTTSFAYTQKHGVASESNYQYSESHGSCKHNVDKAIFKNSGYKEVPSNDHLALKKAVARHPVSIGIEASSTTFQLYKKGVISSGCSTNLDHAVLFVGYDTDKNGQDYWIAKNSWGAKWGLKGYFHIARGSQNNGQGVCGVNMLASYPTL